MQIEQEIPLLKDLLSEWEDLIGAEYRGYRNHVYRMVHFCLALKECNAEEREKIIIAGAFHDIGIWIENTADYIEPSVPPAMAYLEGRSLQAWCDEIALMITEHHKLREYVGGPSDFVELFRKGDLVDFSLGLFKFGLSKSTIKEVKNNFPNASFHKNLGKLAARWFVKHPLNPVPMMKW
ncbi:MAG: hypothetical protein AB9Q22_11840 [Candidatus Reddybacter sp.]